jgi:hypothetical protein
MYSRSPLLRWSGIERRSGHSADEKSVNASHQR